MRGKIPIDGPVDEHPAMPSTPDVPTGTAGLALADPVAAGQWSDFEERSKTFVSFEYEPHGGHTSLMAFFEAFVRRAFPRQDAAYLETDVRNYLDRICAFKAISRGELAQFIREHHWPLAVRDVPQLPEQLLAAMQYRDDPNSKGVLWETERGYWLMSWNRD